MMTASDGGKRIAICGSGIAGLSAAWILSQDARNTITIFEFRDTLGMDADSIDLQLTPRPGQPPKTVRVDAPPRAFSAGYYPTLMSMYERAGVEIMPMDWSLCAFVNDDDGAAQQQQREHVLWHGGRWSERSVLSNSLRFFLRLLREAATKGPRHVLRSARVLADWARFYWWDMPRAIRAAREDRAGAGAAQRRQRFGDFLAAAGYSRDFEQGIVLPMLSMVCTCSFEAVRSYPTAVVLEYLGRKSAQYRTRRGTAYTAALLAAAPNVSVHCSTRVLAVEPRASSGGGGGGGGGGGKCDRPTVTVARRVLEAAGPAWESEEGGSEVHEFDAVIVATQANTAARLVRGASEPLLAALRGFPFELSTGAMHTDASYMPSDRADWLPMSMRVTPGMDGSAFTMWLSGTTAGLEAEPPVFQTWNHEAFGLADGSVIKTVPFTRPVMTTASEGVMRALAGAQGEGGLYFCGAYALFAIPLQENGVRSAVRVAEMLGSPCPWADPGEAQLKANFERRTKAAVAARVASRAAKGGSGGSAVEAAVLGCCAAAALYAFASARRKA
jgi:predicted NAD/FAD-binding protein